MKLVYKGLVIREEIKMEKTVECESCLFDDSPFGDEWDG